VDLVLVEGDAAGVVGMWCGDGNEGWGSRMWKGCREVRGQLWWRRTSLWTAFKLADAGGGRRGRVAVHSVACFDLSHSGDREQRASILYKSALSTY